MRLVSAARVRSHALRIKKKEYEERRMKEMKRGKKRGDERRGMEEGRSMIF